MDDLTYLVGQIHTDSETQLPSPFITIALADIEKVFEVAPDWEDAAMDYFKDIVPVEGTEDVTVRINVAEDAVGTWDTKIKDFKKNLSPLTYVWPPVIAPKVKATED